MRALTCLSVMLLANCQNPDLCDENDAAYEAAESLALARLRLPGSWQIEPPNVHLFAEGERRADGSCRYAARMMFFDEDSPDEARLYWVLIRRSSREPSGWELIEITPRQPTVEG